MDGLKKQACWAFRPPILLIMVAALVPIFLSVAEPASAATGVDLAGQPVNPLRAAPGKPVILIFVRTDCPISNRYAPTLRRLSQQYAGQATFWLVYPDRTESPVTIRKHLADYQYTIQALRDPQHSLVRLSEVQVTPEAAVYDRGGVLVYHGRIDNWYQDFGHARSAPTTHELAHAIDAVLSGAKPEVATSTGIGCYISDLK